MSRLVSLLAVAVLAAACGSPKSQAGNGKAPAPSATAATSTGSASDPKAPVAKYEGGTVTAGELDEFAKEEVKKLQDEHEQRVFELRKAALDALIVKRIIDERAAKEGLAAEDLVKREVTDKAPQPSEQEMRAVYDQAKAQGQQLPPYDEVKGQIQQYLVNMKGRDALSAYYDKVRSEANVQVLLQPKRVEVAAEGPAKGPATAPITIVEFSDFECPYCVRAEESVEQVMKAYEGKVRLVYRDFPLPNHAKAQKAAEAAHCAGDQGKYWEMHSKLFENQQALDVPALKGYAKDLSLDMAKFDKCLDGGDKAQVVQDHKKAGEAAGVSGTPAFFINGILLSGAQPFEAFKQVIDSELARGTQTAQK